MACNFSIPFSGAAEDVLNRAKTAVQSKGGTFNGDNTRGSFGISALGSNIKGSYTVKGQNLDIVIDSKPFFLSCGAIESFLKSQLGA